MSLPPDLSTEAASAFEESLVKDEVSLADATDKSVIQAVGLTGQGLIGAPGPILKTPYFRDVALFPISTKPEIGEITTVPLAPWRGTLRRRLDRQTEDVRKRLSNPAAMILVVRGTNYSAENIDDLLKLYFIDHPKNQTMVRTKKPGFWSRILKSLRSKLRR